MVDRGSGRLGRQLSKGGIVSKERQNEESRVRVSDGGRVDSQVERAR